MTKPKDPAEHKKPGPKKSPATIEREKKAVSNWTKKEAEARLLYTETPYMLSVRAIATRVNTTIEVVNKWITAGGWDLLRAQRQMQLTERHLREKGLDLESIHIGCLRLYVESINAGSVCVMKERRKMQPNFQQMREAIATAAMAEEQVRKVYQWMPTVEQKLLMREMIEESRVRVRDMIKEYLGNNEPVFSLDDESSDGTD